MADDLAMVTYCGLYCGLCAERTRIPKLATQLHQAMEEEGWPSWGDAVPGFRAFWGFLSDLQSGECPGCRTGGGFPACEIRKCARERSLRCCADCSGFPCSKVEELATVYPTLVADNRRLQAVGLEKWLAEQEERVRRGVVYADIRYQRSSE